jgi:hypothetical protein
MFSIRRLAVDASPLCRPGSAQMQRASLKLNVRPLQAAKLGRSQAMPEGDQDHGRVTLTPAT